MKKVLLSILLMLLPILANAETVEIDGIWYNLASQTKEAEVTYNPNGYSGYSGSIEIPASVTYNEVKYSVTTIGKSTFSGCSGLTSVTIPNSVTSIGEYTFSICSLTSVTIPSSVTYIGDGAFSVCSCLTSVTIPNSVTYIGEKAFFYCSHLTSVTIPSSVTSIGDQAFSYCSRLTSVTIPNSVTYIDDSVFFGCSGLTSVTIPNSVTSIGCWAFSCCSGLTSVIIPNSVTSIGFDAFNECSGLEDFYCWAENVPNVNEYGFGEIPFELAKLHVPSVSVEAYKHTFPWGRFGEIVALTDDDPKPTGVNSLKADNDLRPEATYSLDGRRLSNPQRGLNIIRMSDGTTKKVMIK